nr:hypothetical protein [Tanacetum cinerariifolium]
MDQNTDSSGFDQIQPSQYPVIQHPFQEMSEEVFQAKGNLMKSIQTFLKKFNRIPFGEMPKVLLQDLQIINEELAEYINSPSWNRLTFNNDEEHYIQYKEYLENSSNAIAPILPIEEPEYSLSMGYEHLSTIPKMKSSEVIKSSVKNLVPIPSEYEVASDDESECDLPVKDESSLVFTTFSNPLFNCNDDFTSSDDESLSEEDVPMENFKVYLNPLFDDGEINSDNIDPHYFSAESNLIESLLNRYTLIDSSPKFDFLLKEFSGELAHINLILSRIKEADFDLEEEIRLVKNLFDSLINEIELFLATDDLMPPCIESDDYDSEGDIHFLEELLGNDSIPLFENKSYNFDHHDDPSFSRPPPEPPDVEFFFDFEPNSREVISAVMNNIDELNEDECFDPGGIYPTMIEDSRVWCVVPVYLSFTSFVCN